jgi:hypothetical protein
MDAQERSRRAAAGEPLAQMIAGPAWATPGPFMDRVRAGEFATPKIRSWREQIQTISTDLSDLLASRTVIERLRRAIAENPRLQTYNFLLDRLFRWYATSTLVMAYRDLDVRGDVVSMRRLLEDIRKNAGELTRDRFRKLHTGSDVIAERSADPESLSAFIMGRSLEEYYTTIADAKGRNLSVDAIAAEIDEIVTAAEDVHKARMTVYAHRSAAGPALNEISLASIHNLVDVLDRVVNKYRKVLLYEPYLDGHTPVDQTNWPEILTFPWILPRESDTSVPYAATPAVARTLLRALPDDERRELLREFLD